MAAPENGQLDQSVSRVNHDWSVAYSCDRLYMKLHDEVVCKTGQFEPGPPTCIPSKYLGFSEFVLLQMSLNPQNSENAI